jgi:hypothetical protein
MEGRHQQVSPEGKKEDTLQGPFWGFTARYFGISHLYRPPARCFSIRIRFELVIRRSLRWLCDGER